MPARISMDPDQSSLQNEVELSGKPEQQNIPKYLIHAEVTSLPIPIPTKSKRNGPQTAKIDVAKRNPSTREKAITRIYYLTNSENLIISGYQISMVRRPLSESTIHRGALPQEVKGAVTSTGLTVQGQEELPESGGRNGHVE